MTRREIREEMEAAHARDKLATEIYDTGYNEGKTAAEEAAARAASNTDNGAEENTPKITTNTNGAVPISPEPATNAAAVPTAAKTGTPAAENKQIMADDILNKILNGDGFRYNLASDPTFQQLAAKARGEAKLEKADTLAHQTAMTGGYGNTWAQAAAERAYDARMQQLYDQVPALEAEAYDRYKDERAELRDQYSILASREAAALENDWREREFEYQQYRDKVGDDQWAQEFGLKADAQAWAQHMDEMNFTLAEAEYYLKEKVELGQLSLAQAEQALAELKFAHDQQMDYIAADQNQQTINLDAEDLYAHINGTYYKGETTGTTAPKAGYNSDGTKKRTDKEIQAAAESWWSQYRAAWGSEKTLDTFMNRLISQYSDDADRIMAILENKAAAIDDNITRKGVKIYGYTD